MGMSESKDEEFGLAPFANARLPLDNVLFMDTQSRNRNAEGLSETLSRVAWRVSQRYLATSNEQNRRQNEYELVHSTSPRRSLMVSESLRLRSPHRSDFFAQSLPRNNGTSCVKFSPTAGIQTRCRARDKLTTTCCPPGRDRVTSAFHPQ